MIDSWDISCELALRWMSLDLTDDKSTLVQVMAWCCQATSHYLSQCWPRSLSPYGVTRPQWVNKNCWRYQSLKHVWISHHLRFLLHVPGANGLIVSRIALSCCVYCCSCYCLYIIIKSPWYTGADLMFLHRFVCCGRLQALVQIITSKIYFYLNQMMLFKMAETISWNQKVLKKN